jgi:hypothetical protein
MLAHILFHSLCENKDELSKMLGKRAGRGQENNVLEGKGCGQPGFAQIVGRAIFLFRIKTFKMSPPPCTQSCPQKLCETGDKPDRRCNQEYCHIFQRGKIVEENQLHAIVRRALPTVLSTGSVSKSQRPKPLEITGFPQHMPKCPASYPLPCFYAWQNFP